ncbi:MAG: hypothetical protein IGS03_08415 [Candidatus Sericytochromatia bacterium]|nr:hypothetical protein [Candidatus Sericytochromatia bacterium]
MAVPHTMFNQGFVFHPTGLAETKQHPADCVFNAFFMLAGLNFIPNLYCIDYKYSQANKTPALKHKQLCLLFAQCQLSSTGDSGRRDKLFTPSAFFFFLPLILAHTVCAERFSQKSAQGFKQIPDN